MPTEPGGRVEITQVYGAQELVVGQATNFRVRLAPGFAQPVEYTWDFGDGTLSVGNNAVHWYTRPGRYTATVVSRNAVNADTARFAVTVRSDRATPPLPAVLPPSASSPPPSSALGPIVWVTDISSTRSAAEQAAAQYQAAGHRAGVVSVAKEGAVQYYAVVGGYRNEQEAVRAKPGILRGGARPLWLLRLTPENVEALHEGDTP